MKMASAFMLSVRAMSTSPVAAALTWKSWVGLDTQLNIWIGRTVKGDMSHSNDRNGASACTGGGGRKAMKVSAPMVTSGAVSPMARDMAMMTHVAMPPVEYGRR